MSFAWPLALLSLWIVPLLLGLYTWLIWRREASAARLRGMTLADRSSGRAVTVHRHIPPAIFLAAILLLLAALARPHVTLSLPRMEGTVILAFDTSTSMVADDLKPSRIEAAKRAAATFVRDQPSSVQLSVVAFSDGSLVVQRPTNARSDVLAAISRLQPQGGTSLSEALFASLGAITGRNIVLPEGASEEDLLGMDIGYFGSAVIVLLSDGEHTSRSDPLNVAQLAANAGVRVFPIGIGSPDGATIEVDGFRVASVLNEPLLTEIARLTDGRYFRAQDEGQLARVYDTIDLKLAVRGERTEVTSAFAIASMLLLVIGAALTTRWFGRVP
ncbi:MAG: VWA domain-containing protein [Chloroflexi bacterium]|nr:VWA domain-containing protein [Chloroflexota bacterium]